MAVLVLTAAVPLLILSTSDYWQLRRLGERLAERSQKVLEERARSQLLLMIETASEMAKRERVGVNYALLYQQSLSEEFSRGDGLGHPGDRTRLEEGFKTLDDWSPDLIFRQFTIWKDGDLVSRPVPDAAWPAKDLRQTAWYKKVLKEDGHVFSTQASDETGGRVMLMLALPVRDREGRAVGVTGLEILPQRVIDMTHLPDNWGKDTKLFLVNAEKSAKNKVDVIAIQENDWARPAQVEELKSDDPVAFENLLAQIRAGETGVLEMPYRGKKSLWAFGSTGRNGSAILFILPHAAVVQEALEVEAFVYEEVGRQLMGSAILFVVIVSIVIILAWVSSHHLTIPMRKLLEATRAIGRGDFSVRVDIQTRDELEELGRTFNQMVPDLEERVRIKESLAVATGVQGHLLPREALSLPGLAISGRAVYCDEIGGDYFDYFAIMQKEKPLAVLAVGDVTGHGIPSALLMATARALLHSYVALRSEDDTLADVLGQMNNQLARDAVGGRFMTLFCLVISPENGHMVWGSAGHDPALVCRAESGAVEELTGGGLALGIVADRIYEPHRGTLAAGDVVVLGTDGIWEARNPEDEMFGKERLARILKEQAGKEVAEIQERILAEVKAFQGTAVQNDDITVVVAKKTAG